MNETDRQVGGEGGMFYDAAIELILQSPMGEGGKVGEGGGFEGVQAMCKRRAHTAAPVLVNEGPGDYKSNATPRTKYIIRSHNIIAR